MPFRVLARKFGSFGLGWILYVRTHKDAQSGILPLAPGFRRGQEATLLAHDLPSEVWYVKQMAAGMVVYPLQLRHSGEKKYADCEAA